MLGWWQKARLANWQTMGELFGTLVPKPLGILC